MHRRERCHADTAPHGVSRIDRAPIVFSCLGHLYVHFCTAFYFVIVLALERDWERPFHELIELWTLGSLLVGLAALPAGLLGDRIGSARMMAVFFVGMGAGSCAAGLSSSTEAIMASLAVIGLFASIYHPVGIPWLVRHARTRPGKSLGVNGIFGSAGSALAGIVSGSLVDLAGWRAAFLVPGLVCGATGAVLFAFLASGRIRDERPAPRADSSEPSADGRRVVGILLATMFLAGLVFHATQTSLPKLFEQRHGGLVEEGAFGIGLLVALVYGAAGIMQVMGGHLADRYPLKPVYLGAILLQVPLLWVAASISGLPLVVVATLMVMANASALPAENMLLARHTPERRHGLFFGVKFVMTFGAAPLAVALVSTVSSRTGELHWLYVFLSLFALAAFVIAAFLPSLRAPLTESVLVPTMEETTQI
ncbi:MAG TPA: MFS transporter [Vicinamibacteria bacterium]|nr:MFS transporter [Vicinamibacteria bacterium]